MQISTDGRDSREVWTTASTVDEALSQLQMTDKAPAAASRGSRVPLAGMSLPVVSAKTVQIADAGVVRTVSLAAPNVAACSRPRAYHCKQSDEVVPAASSPIVDGMQIQVKRVRIEKVTERVPLPPANHRIEDPALNMSRQIVEDPGTPGNPGRHVCHRKDQRRRDRENASSQCRGRPSSRRCSEGWRQAWYRGSGSHQRRYLGRPRSVRSRR